MMAMKKVFCLALIGFFTVSAFAQNVPAKASGEFAAEGTGTGASSQLAVEAAKIAAVNALVKSVIKRDTIYRDLLMSEAFKNDWFRSVESKERPDRKWEAKAVVRVDEGVADALYYGRYSTTVGALLDQAETAVAEAEPLLADGGTRESNGDIGGAETSYRRAASKTDEAFRLIGPVEDAVFFSSVGNRKAPELKAVIGTLRASAAEGLDRVKESRNRLAVDAAYKNVLDLLQTVEDELKGLEATADELYPLAGAPRSYETDRLSSARDRAKTAHDALARRRSLVHERSEGLAANMEYPRARVKLVIDRIDSISARFDAVSSAVNGELFRRSPPVQAAVWTFNHMPSDVVAIGLSFPFGVAPGSEGVESTSFPIRLDARAESAFSLGSGGIWCRTEAVYDSERLWSGSESSYIAQGVDIGFYGSGLFAAGFRWDWTRRFGEVRVKQIKAVAVTLGTAGAGLGTKHRVPLWITTFTWELPQYDGFLFAREINLGVESVLRPSPWIRLEAGISSRAREVSGGGFSYLARGKLGFAFRLPVLRPLLWRLSYEGAYRSSLNDGNADGSGKMDGAFRFGIEYTF